MHEEPLALCEAAATAAFAERPRAQLARDMTVYLAHVGAGLPMRAIAAARGTAPSTVMRAVRRVEHLRDDPLVERTLAGLEAALSRAGLAPDATEKELRVPRAKTPAPTMTRADIAVMRRLCEPEAFLMAAHQADKAGVFCRTNQFRRPLSLIEIDKAIAYLKRDWIKCISRTDISARYEATLAGRAALKRAIGAEQPREATGFAEAPSVFSDQHRAPGERRVVNMTTGEVETIRVNVGESPLGWLARRKNANGDPLLAPAEVEAGERLREDFELAQIGPSVAQNWKRFLAPTPTGGSGRTPSEGPMFARERVAHALEALGPGLSDVALRVCCFLEGLEATERRMGWSARSGKVVLKLALQRLVDHYGLKDSAAGEDRAAS